MNLKTKRYYLDACIWRDYLENRTDNMRPLGEWALELINKIIKEEDLIVYSELVKDELLEKFSDEEIDEAFSIVPSDLLVKSEITKKEIMEARQKSYSLETPFKDTLHAIIARDNQSTLITRDKHFIELLDIVDVNKPEDLL